MLPLSKQRALLGSTARLSDDELKRLSGSLYELARCALVAMGSPSAPRSTRRQLQLVELAPPDRREELEERAAIREFDGGLPRPEAELAALRDLGLVD